MQVSAENEFGSGDFGKPVAFRTNERTEFPPPTPTAARATAKQFSLALEWAPVTDASSYKVIAAPVGTPGAAGSEIQVYLGGKPKADITASATSTSSHKLVTQREYLFRVQALNSVRAVVVTCVCPLSWLYSCLHQPLPGWSLRAWARCRRHSTGAETSCPVRCWGVA